ncbi:hypothetical protein H072_6290 [Dactylellina haptotyla CBS 200.50]|uniref:Phospholipase A2 n=1 Tax=Dactylellina haptotyla (strain CBS 200.50) TaxID=1284197 RepID=S8AFE8_DACHA|nr:hypothetical protein H072_6290 [Dactylellina haptotyla CBS 200.50]
MVSKNLLFLVSATLVALSHSLPASAAPKTPADYRAKNPFPSKEPYIHLTTSPNPAIRVRTVLSGRAVSAPSCAGATQCETNKLIFTITLGEFVNNYRAKGVDSPPLVYDSDGCSVPKEVADFFHIDKDFPYGYAFLDSCYRHDFGYRNFKAQDRFTEPNRQKLDQKLKEDLLNQCSAQYPNANIFHPLDWLNKTWCEAVAGVYFDFVRLCGRDNCTLDAAKQLFQKVLH